MLDMYNIHIKQIYRIYWTAAVNVSLLYNYQNRFLSSTLFSTILILF